MLSGALPCHLHQLRQYLYFCTSKANMLSTFWLFGTTGSDVVGMTIVNVAP
jgi:hypothetical protein